jgi:hypothetical protein
MATIIIIQNITVVPPKPLITKKQALAAAYYKFKLRQMLAYSRGEKWRLLRWMPQFSQDELGNWIVTNID